MTLTPLTKTLRALGYEGDQVDFERVLWTEFRAMFLGWTVDRLVCNPRSAIRFCDRIREYVPKATDPVCLKALMAIRKNEKWKLYE